jgi:hypothetical protein
VAQEGNTDELLWDPLYLLADVARTITFERGDMRSWRRPSASPAISAPFRRRA